MLLFAALYPAAYAQQDGVNRAVTVDALRHNFHVATELCLESVRSQTHFEEMPEALELFAKLPQSVPPERVHNSWSIAGIDSVLIWQSDANCQATWLQSPNFAEDIVPFDAIAEFKSVIGRLLALIPPSPELSDFRPWGSVVSQKMSLVESGRSLRLYIWAGSDGSLHVAVNRAPYLKPIMDPPFSALEGRCLQTLADRQPVGPSPLDRNPDSSLEPETGFVFYGSTRFGRIGFNPNNPMACAFHEQSISLGQARALIPDEQWGLKFSIDAAPGGGVIVIARVP